MFKEAIVGGKPSQGTKSDKRLKRNRERRTMTRADQQQSETQALPEAAHVDNTDKKAAWYGPQPGSGPLDWPNAKQADFDT